ncbi:MAG: hypothetical protein ACQERO_12065, partial [Bacteroidota bacterium]
MCETKCPGRGIIYIAPYKRRGVAGAQCGVITSMQPKHPEADDLAEVTGKFEGGMIDLNRG